MPFDNDGIFSKRSSAAVRRAFIAALREQFGEDFDIGVGSPARKLVEAMMVIPFAERENDLDNMFRQAYFATASGSNLERIVEPLGFQRLQPLRSTGVIEYDFKTAQDTAGSQFLAKGDISFAGTNGATFELLQGVARPSVTDSFVGAGTASNTLDGISFTKIAQKVTLGSESYLQTFRFQVNHVSGTPTIRVRLETDNSGEPSGTLAHDNLDVSGLLPSDGVEESHIWAAGGYVDAGDYWLVIEREDGSFTMEGSVGGTADQLQTYNGATWAADTNAENMAYSIIRTVPIAVRSTGFGLGTIQDAEAINRITFANQSASTTWSSLVASFGNQRAVDGARELESDPALRLRVRNSFTPNITASPDGLVNAILSAGARAAKVIENTADVGSYRDIMFESTETGTGGQIIDATTTRTAQRVTTTEERWVQNFTATLGSDTNLNATVSLQTDVAGEPSGTLAFEGAQRIGFDFDGTNESSGTFEEGAYLPAGTYWLVFERTAGSGVFDGGTGGTADQVLTGDPWVADTNIENMNCKLVGGIPPHSFRAYVTGGTDDRIAQAIWTAKSAGIRSDGIEEGTALDLGGVSRTINFERPQVTNVVVSITVEVSPQFTGTEDTIRDSIVNYIGGELSSGAIVRGLVVGQKLYRNEVLSRALDDTYVVGSLDVTECLVGLKSTFPTPAALTPSETLDLEATDSENFDVEFPDADISVTLVVV